jgi:hypothetical protein
MEEPSLDILERIVATRGGFGHREHLELAWACLDRYREVDAAHEAVAAAVRHLARRHGMPHRYHETLTRAWVVVVALHRAIAAGDSFDAFIAVHPRLLERDLLSRHYSEPLLWSDAARAQWTEPDLRAFPLPA